mgnify:CR=1 FL=1
MSHSILKMEDAPFLSLVLYNHDVNYVLSGSLILTQHEYSDNKTKLNNGHLSYLTNPSQVPPGRGGTLPSLR